MALADSTHSNAAPFRLGLLNGSDRPTGNAVGLLSWLTPILESSLAPLDLVQLNPYTSVLGPIDAPECPFTVEHPTSYARLETRAWSEVVRSCDAIFILTPQHNYGYPASIKLAIDHLGREWSGKAIVLLGYGGRGDGKGVQQLREVLGGALRAKLVGNVGEIKFPMDLVSGSSRLGSQGKVIGAEGGGVPLWLSGWESKVEVALRELRGQ